MNDFARSCGYRVDLAYAREDNLLFGEQIYQPEAKLFLYKDLASIVKKAALYAHSEYNMRLVLYDGLRTVEAQERMLRTQRAYKNPQWFELGLLSKPGSGGHPRGMAVDVSLETQDGELLDMGTPFDYLTENSHHNPAHRDFKHPEHITTNRKMLDSCITHGAAQTGITVIGLPQEWWDYRLPSEIYDQYIPIRDEDLPREMKLCINNFDDHGFHPDH